MRVTVELEPESAESTRVLDQWRSAWSVTASGSGVELIPAAALAALLDLKNRSFDRGLTVNATFSEQP